MTPTWEYFSGVDYFEHRAPCDPSLIGKFRKMSGQEGVEELLAKTIAVAVNLKLVSKDASERVVVDTTVQSNEVAHLTDSRLPGVYLPSWLD